MLAPQRATTAAACDARSAGRAPSSAVLPSQWATFTAACGACSVRCSQRWAFTVERSARVAEGDVRRSVRRLQRWACTVERSACVAEGDVCRSVRSSQRWACTAERSARVADGDVRRSAQRVLTATLLRNGGARAMICRAVLHGPHHVLFSGAPQMPSAGWGCFHSRASSVAFVRSTAVAGCRGSVAAICLTIGTHALSRSSCWKSVRPAGVVASR